MPDSLENQRAARHKLMTEAPLAKVIPTIAVPMILSMLIESIYNLADTYFVSQLGMAATAAVGVNDSLMHLMMSISMGFGAGASSYISRLLGAKDYDSASRAGTTALYTAMLFGAAFAVVCYIFMGPFISLLGATATSKPYAIDYATYILIGAPITAANMVLGELLRSEGSSKLSAVGQGVGCIVNCALDPLFINTFGLGVAGAAIATTLSKVVSLIVLVVPFIKKKSLIEIKFKFFTPKWSIYREIAKMGIPSFLRSSLMTFSSILTNNLAGGYGDYALAAISVGNKCMRLVGTAVMGFGMGFQPVAGYCYGAKKYERVLKAFWFTVFLGCCGALIVGSAIVIFAPQIVGIFTTADATDVIELGTFMVRLNIFALPFHMFVMVAAGIYQALGHALGSTILNLSRSVIFLVPSILIMSAIAGVQGLASAQAVADLIGMIVGIPMFLHIRKQLLKEEAAYKASLNN